MVNLNCAMTRVAGCDPGTSSLDVLVLHKQMQPRLVDAASGSPWRRIYEDRVAVVFVAVSGVR